MSPTLFLVIGGIAFLTFGLIVAIVFATTNFCTSNKTCTLKFGFSVFPETSLQTIPYHSDENTVKDAENRCRVDPECFAFVRYNDQNYYHSSSARSNRFTTTNSTLYVKTPFSGSDS